MGRIGGVGGEQVVEVVFCGGEGAGGANVGLSFG